MKTGIVAVTASIAAVALAAPAFADDHRRDRREWREDRRDDRREWREDRRERGQAYRQGYRAGVRADDRADRRYERQYRNNRYVYVQPQYRGSVQRPYYNNRWNDGYGGPVYSGANYRSNNNYWWGPQGQVYCRRSDGTTGTIVGAVAGGTLGNIIAQQGDKRLGSIIGGTLGAILGRELDRGNARCR